MEPQTRDKSFVAPNDHHDEEIGDHDHIDQSEHGEHDRFFIDVGGLLNQVQEFDEKVIHIDSLGNDEPEVKRRLEPTAEKYQATKGVL